MMLHELTLNELTASLAAGEVSSREAMQACLDRIDAVELGVIQGPGHGIPLHRVVRLISLVAHQSQNLVAGRLQLFRQFVPDQSSRSGDRDLHCQPASKRDSCAP